MNSLSQYIELYHQNAQEINAGSADALNALRPAAAEALSRASLPERGDEDYEQTSVNEMFAPDYGLNINRMNFQADIAASFRCDVPNMSTLLGVVVNDTFRPSKSLLSGLPKGVTFTSLRQAAIENNPVVTANYGKIAPIANPTVALNTLLAQDGVLIHISRGVRLEKPLQLVNIFSSPIPMMAPRRILVVLEDGASAKLLVCDHTQDSKNAYLSSEVVEIILGADASFDYYTIEESSLMTTRHSDVHCRQGQNSRFASGSITLTCGNTRNNFCIDLAGEHSDCHLAGMVIGSDSQHIDNNVRLNHLVPHCTSNQLFKYVLDGKSSGAFSGLIHVAENAKFTDANQTDRNLLASADARMHAKPQLEIYNDDVKCSHGATTGQLDSDTLFYMQSRGIPEPEARKMLMQAFMADVIDSVDMEELRDRLRHLVEKRFSGGLNGCESCHSGCRNSADSQAQTN